MSSMESTEQVNGVDGQLSNTNTSSSLGQSPDGQTPSTNGTESTSADATQLEADDRPLSPLMAACSELDSAKVEELLNSGHATNVRNDHGESLLHVMIHKFVELFPEEQTKKKSSAMGILRLLLGSGLDINSVCEDMETPLHVLAHYDVTPEVVMALLASGAKVNLLNKHGNSALHIAATKRNYVTLQSLIDGGADVNATNGEGLTCLHMLARGRHNKGAVEILLRCGAAVNIEDLGGRTPLHMAAKWCRLDVMSELIRCKATVNATDKAGLTPLHYAVLGDITGKSVDMLMSSGAHGNAQDYYTGETALHKAIRANSVENAKQILRFHPGLNIRDVNGETPIHAAAQCMDIAIWQTLLERGCDLNSIENKQGLTAIQKLKKCQNYVAQGLIYMSQNSHFRLILHSV